MTILNDNSGIIVKDETVSITCKLILTNSDTGEVVERTTAISPTIVPSEFVEDSLVITLDGSGQGSAVVSTTNDNYQSVEWTVTDHTDHGGEDEARSGPFPVEVGVNRGVTPVSRLEPWANLRTELNAVPENGEIDLEGRGFYMTFDDKDVITPARNVTIKNGIFAGGPRLDWSPLNDGSGLWVADLPEEGRPGNAFQDKTLHSVLAQLTIPRLQKNIPFQAFWPTNTQIETWPWDIGFYTESSGGFWLSGAGGVGGPGFPADKPETYGDSNNVEDWRAVNVETNVGNVLTEINNGIGGYDAEVPLLDYNLWGGEIRGLQITDPTIIAELNSIFDGKDPSNFHIMINSDANLSKDFPITEWNPVTNVLGIDGRGFNWNGYMHFIITGSKDFIAGRSNRFAVEFDGNNAGKIYYLPPDETSWLDEDGTPEGFYPIRDRGFNNADETTFDRCVFHSWGQHSTTPGTIRPLKTDEGYVTLNDCLFFGCAVAGFQGRFHSYSTYYYYLTFRGFSGIADGSRFVNNNFYGMPRNSAIFVSGKYGLFEDTNGDGEWTGSSSVPGSASDEPVYPGPMQETLCAGNFFDITFSNHGQGISTYINSWNNSIIKNNIFYNCANAMSHQPQASFGTAANPFTSKCLFENNLIIYTRNFGKGFKGQSTWSFNSQTVDEHMPPLPRNLSHQNDETLNQDNQQVRYWNNTVLVNFNHPSWSDGILPPRDADELSTGYYVQRSKLRHSDTVFSNNLIIGSAPSETEWLNGGHVQFNNLYVTDDSNQPRGVASGYGYYDNPNTPLSEVYNFDTNEVIGNALTSGSDGGRVGVRWASYPPDEVLKNIPINWADIYVGDEDVDRIGGETEAELQTFLQQHETAGGIDPYVQGTQDRRPGGIATLVQRVKMTGPYPVNSDPRIVERILDADTGTDGETVFQFGGEYTMTSSWPEMTVNADGDVTKLYFLHGSQVLNMPGGRSISQGRFDFETNDQQTAYYDKYEIRFTFRSADGTIVNGTEDNPIPFRDYYSQPISNGSYGAQPSYLTLTPSQSDPVGDENGIPRFLDDDVIEYFIYRLDQEEPEDEG